MKNACGGVCFGVLLFFGSFPLLVWNEGRSIERYESLEEGKKVVVPVGDPSAAVDPNNEGKLIHITGTAEAGSNVSDAFFGISPPNVLKLRRDVEMMQWKESKSEKTEKTNGGGERTVTTYSYSKVWSSYVINSAGFYESDGHENPSVMPFTSLAFAAKPINIGSFELSDALVSRINWYSGINDAVSVDSISDESTRSEAKKYGNGFFFGQDPAYPEVGDVKIMFQAVPEDTVTVVGSQSGNSFSSYLTQRGGTILLLRRGPHTPEEMFLLAEKDNVMLTWALRFAGFFVMFLGLKMIIQPLEVMADVIPVIGPFVGDLVGAASGALVALVAGVLSSLVIAVSWFFYRPLFAALFLSVTGVLIYSIKKKLEEQKASHSDASSPLLEFTNAKNPEYDQV